MGLFDGFQKLIRPYDEEEDEFLDEMEMEQEEAETPEEKPRANPFASFSAAPQPSQPQPAAAPARAPRFREGKVVNLGAGGQMQVVLIKPERFETAAEIADHLRDKRTVLLNLETTRKDITRRLVDFLSGAVYVMDGHIRKVASCTYIITPPGVDLMGDLMDELENTGLSF